MLKFLRLKNYKSHEDSIVHLDKGVNVLFGLSQAGKTNFLRAFRLLSENRPLGGKFFSDFAGDKGQVKVTAGLIGVDGEISVTKDIRIDKDGEKKAARTSYQIGAKEFSSPKDQVPDEISAALNISELNIQDQFDPPFLVASSGGEIAKTINRITRLEEVDDWVSELTREINAVNRDIVRVEEEAKDLINQIDVYKDIDDTEQVVAELQVVVGDISKLLSQQDSLDKLLIGFENAERALEKFEGLTEVEQNIKEAEALQEDIDDCCALVLLLTDYESKIFDDSDLVRAERYVAKIAQIDEELAVFNEMQEAVSGYTIADANVGLKASLLEKTKKQYSDMLGQRCPTCFVSIDSKRKKEIMEIL